jgi:hypothetical protein
VIDQFVTGQYYFIAILILLYVLATPGPPQSLQVKATGYGEITLDWTPQPDSLGWKIKYTILYHAQGDLINKVVNCGFIFAVFFSLT